MSKFNLCNHINFIEGKYDENLDYFKNHLAALSLLNNEEERIQLYRTFAAGFYNDLAINAKQKQRGFTNKAAAEQVMLQIAENSSNEAMSSITHLYNTLSLLIDSYDNLSCRKEVTKEAFNLRKDSLSNHIIGLLNKNKKYLDVFFNMREGSLIIKELK